MRKAAKAVELRGGVREGCRVRGTRRACSAGEDRLYRAVKEGRERERCVGDGMAQGRVAGFGVGRDVARNTELVSEANKPAMT